MSGHRERGLALVSVLWAVAILSLIAAAMLSAGMLSLRISRNAWDQTEAQALADAGINRAILALLDNRPAQRWRTDDGAQDFSFGGANVRVSIQDEYGKIDINLAGHDQLRDLFRSQGASAEDASTLADHIIAWRSPADPSSDAMKDYRNAGYAPRGGPFQSVDELKLVAGMTPELFARVEPALTVYSHQREFDLNTAPKEVLLTIPGMDEARAAAQIASRNGASTSTAPDMMQALAGRAFSIRSDVQKGRVRASRLAVVEFTADPAHPYWILNWK